MHHVVPVVHLLFGNDLLNGADLGHGGKLATVVEHDVLSGVSVADTLRAADGELMEFLHLSARSRSDGHFKVGEVERIGETEKSVLVFTFVALHATAFEVGGHHAEGEGIAHRAERTGIHGELPDVGKSFGGFYGLDALEGKGLAHAVDHERGGSIERYHTVELKGEFGVTGLGEGGFVGRVDADELRGRVNIGRCGTGELDVVSTERGVAIIVVVLRSVCRHLHAVRVTQHEFVAGTVDFGGEAAVLTLVEGSHRLHDSLIGRGGVEVADLIPSIAHLVVHVGVDEDFGFRQQFLQACAGKVDGHSISRSLVLHLLQHKGIVLGGEEEAVVASVLANEVVERHGHTLLVLHLGGNVDVEDISTFKFGVGSCGEVCADHGSFAGGKEDAVKVELFVVGNPEFDFLLASQRFAGSGCELCGEVALHLLIGHVVAEATQGAETGGEHVVALGIAHVDELEKHLAVVVAGGHHILGRAELAREVHSEHIAVDGVGDGLGIVLSHFAFGVTEAEGEHLRLAALLGHLQVAVEGSGEDASGVTFYPVGKELVALIEQSADADELHGVAGTDVAYFTRAVLAVEHTFVGGHTYVLEAEGDDVILLELAGVEECHEVVAAVEEDGGAAQVRADALAVVAHHDFRSRNLHIL